MTSLALHRPRRAGRLPAALLLLLLPSAAGAQIALCPVPVDPTPTGSLDRPPAPFPAADHFFLHSSDHLQGRLAKVKWAGGLIYQPPAESGFDQFTSAVVVDNPHPTQTLQIQIEYFDQDGNQVGLSLPPPIQPEGFHIEAAFPIQNPLGVGSARVTSLDGHELVGSVLLHTRCVTNLQGLICDDDIPHPTPGASSLQQLQIDQGSRELWWGPLPLTLTSNIDFFNAQAPFFWVVNPNDVPNKIRVDLVAYDRISGTMIPFTWRQHTLQPRGTLLEKAGPHLTGVPVDGLWDQFYSWYATLPQPYDYDVMVHVVSESSLPILGDGVMTDFYGSGDAGSDPPVPIAGDKFRMASHMLASTPTWRLIDPDFSYQPGGVIQTLIGLFNAGTANAGPIRIQYFDNNGTLISTGNIPVLLPNQSVRIEPGTLGYPAVPVGFGWVRIDGCSGDKLVGWSVREVVPTGVPHYHKAFGEILDGNGGKEPGDGFRVTNANGTWNRKVSTIVRTWAPTFYWPGYTTFANTSVGNVGRYWDLFFDEFGGACTAVAGQPFAGVPFARTSTTYEDPQSICGPANLSGRVDVTTGRIKGIHVLGDPFVEWGIPGFAGVPIEPE